MFSGFLIALVVLGALVCPVMMLLGRRAIGPGCQLIGCWPRSHDNVDRIRARQRTLAEQIARLEARQADKLPS